MPGTNTSLKSKLGKLKPFLYPLLLGIVVLILFASNYKAGTWLMGWDNLLQEMNFSANWERHLSSTWQEFQGVGMETGISWGADLPRIVYLRLLSVIFPNDMLRYLYMFTCVYVGALGFFYFVRWLLKQNIAQEKLKLTAGRLGGQVGLISFLGALFYIFNHGTIEIFYAPIETFPTQYAFLPWLFWYFFKILSERKKIKNYLIFAILNLLAAPMAQVPTTFAVYFAAILLSGAVFSISKLQAKEFKSTLRKFGSVILLTLLINSFWILPFASFLLSGGTQTVRSSTVNQLFSEDIYYRNAARGNLADVALLRGYLYDTYDYSNKDEQFQPMMQDWIEHYDAGITVAVGYIFFAIILLGLVTAFVKKWSLRYVFLALFVLSLFFLFSANSPTGFLFEWLRNVSTVFREAFRFPYTKILQLAIFVYAILFVYGLVALQLAIKKVLRNESLVIITLCVVFGFVLYSAPALDGHFFSEDLRVKLPSEYSQVFEWFKDKPQQARIANIPQAEIQNWWFSKWGYRGGGFLWYGVKQPVLDRAFDNWNSTNEDYFWEINDAIYKKDVQKISELLEKYQVGWLLYDRNVILDWQENNSHEQFYDRELLPEILKDKRFKKEVEFENKIVIISYLPTLQNPSYLKVEPNSVFAKTDLWGQAEVKQNLVKGEGSYSLTKTFSVPGRIELPDYWQTENYAYLKLTEIEQSDAVRIVEVSEVSPEIKINNNQINKLNKIKINLPLNQDVVIASSIDAFTIKANQVLASESVIAIKKDDSLKIFVETETKDLTSKLIQAKVQNCTDLLDQDADINKQYQDGVIKIEAESAVACIEATENFNSSAQLAAVQFNYHSESNSYPAVCLQTNGICIAENKITTLGLPLAGKQKYNNYFRTTAKDLKLRLSLYEEEGVAASLEFDSIKLALFQQLTTISVRNGLEQKRLLDVEAGDQLRIEFPRINSGALSYTANLSDLSKLKPVNCIGESFSGPTANVATEYNEYTEELVYTATNAENCQVLFNREALPLDTNYVATATVENLEGYIVELRGKEKDLNYVRYHLAFTTGEKSERSLLLTSTSQGRTGLEVSLHALSRDKFTSVNSLSEFEVNWLPLDYIWGIKLRSHTVETADLAISSAERLAPFLYTADVKGTGTLELKQAAAAGWLTLNDQAQKQTNTQNWDNTWQIKAPQQTKVVLLFLPQIAQFIGYILVVLFFYYLGFYSLFTKHLPQKQLK